MHDELINSNEIYLQDVVCSVVAANPRLDDFVLFNKISPMVEIQTLEVTRKILSLIKINK